HSINVNDQNTICRDFKCLNSFRYLQSISFCLLYCEIISNNYQISSNQQQFIISNFKTKISSIEHSSFIYYFLFIHLILSAVIINLPKKYFRKFVCVYLLKKLKLSAIEANNKESKLYSSVNFNKTPKKETSLELNVNIEECNRLAEKNLTQLNYPIICIFFLNKTKNIIPIEKYSRIKKKFDT
ncbi:hypothetical protein RFI_38786, partial [Reticulomyxa filosa]